MLSLLVEKDNFSLLFEHILNGSLEEKKEALNQVNFNEEMRIKEKRNPVIQ